MRARLAGRHLRRRVRRQAERELQAIADMTSCC
jgi:hypothetical protein